MILPLTKLHRVVLSNPSNRFNDQKLIGWVSFTTIITYKTILPVWKMAVSKPIIEQSLIIH